MDTKFISNLLAELMMEHNRVSLPCLGSFLGQYVPARISDDGASIAPPSKRINFHQNEIWNDEKLEKLIARRNKLSLGRAKELVAFWIDDCCLLLSSGSSVVLDGLGTFSVNEENKLVFEQQSTNLLLDSFCLDTLPLPTQTKALVLRPATMQPSPQFVAKLNKRARRKTILKVSAAVLLLALLTIATLAYVDVLPIPNALKGVLPTTKKQAEESVVDTTSKQQLPPAETKQEGVFRIKLGIYKHYNEARAQVRQMEQHGYSAQVFYVAGDTPYHVYLGSYDTRTSGQVVLDFLVSKDSLNLLKDAKIDLAPLEGALEQ